MLDRILFTLFLFISVTDLIGQRELKLATPVILSGDAIIQKGDKLEVAIEFRMEGADIYYTMDGSDPDPSSNQYTKPLLIYQPVKLKAITMHPDYLPSNIITRNFLNAGISYDTLHIDPAPNPIYAAEGVMTLMNGRLGGDNFRMDYLGFDEGPVTLKIINHKKKKTKSITISYLVNQGSWIFAPEIVTLSKENYSHIFPSINESPSKKLIHIKLKPKRRKIIEMTLRPIRNIPSWHSGRGKSGWLFIDEVIIE